MLPSLRREHPKRCDPKRAAGCRGTAHAYELSLSIRPWLLVLPPLMASELTGMLE